MCMILNQGGSSLKSISKAYRLLRAKASPIVDEVNLVVYLELQLSLCHYWLLNQALKKAIPRYRDV